ncbi:MAG TPA: hypothetical protein VGH66_08685 [Acidimicrobiales bacterium]|jgi:hypothetical protein
MTRRQSLILKAFAVWTVYIWVTLVWNIWHDHTKGHGLGFKMVHTVLAIISITFAVATWRIVTSVRSKRRAEAGTAA